MYGFSYIKAQDESQGHMTSGFMCFLKKKKQTVKTYFNNTNCLISHSHRKKFSKFCRALLKRIFLLMTIPTDVPFVTTAHIYYKCCSRTKIAYYKVAFKLRKVSLYRIHLPFGCVFSFNHSIHVNSLILLLLSCSNDPYDLVMYM